MDRPSNWAAFRIISSSAFVLNRRAKTVGCFLVFIAGKYVVDVVGMSIGKLCLESEAWELCTVFLMPFSVRERQRPPEELTWWVYNICGSLLGCGRTVFQRYGSTPCRWKVS